MSIYMPWGDGTRCHDCFWMLSFKPAFFTPLSPSSRNFLQSLFEGRFVSKKSSLLFFIWTRCLFLKVYFVGYRICSWHFFSFSTWKMPCHFLWYLWYQIRYLPSSELMFLWQVIYSFFLSTFKNLPLFSEFNCVLALIPLKFSWWGLFRFLEL